MDQETMMKKAQELHKKMEEAEKNLKSKVVTAESGGGLVSIEGTADGKISGVFLDPSLFTEDARHIAEDLIKAAFNTFQENIVETTRSISASILNQP